MVRMSISSDLMRSTLGMKDTSDYFFNIWGCATKLQGDLMFQSNWLPCLDMLRIWNISQFYLLNLTVEFDFWFTFFMLFLRASFITIFYLTDSFFSTCENHIIINESCKNNHFSTWIIDFHMIFFHTRFIYFHMRFLHDSFIFKWFKWIHLIYLLIIISIFHMISHVPFQGITCWNALSHHFHVISDYSHIHR